MKLPHGVCKPIHTYAYDVKVLSSKEMTNYMWPLMMVSEIMLHRWESVMSVNVDGVFLLTAEFLGQPGGVGVRLFRPLFGVS